MKKLQFPDSWFMKAVKRVESGSRFLYLCWELCISTETFNKVAI
jgi:hypothetical protein